MIDVEQESGAIPGQTCQVSRIERESHAF